MRGEAGGPGRQATLLLLSVLLLEALALALALLLLRWLQEVLPSAGQTFVLLLVGALTGYLAELILRGPRPLGYAGSLLAGMVGGWVGSNLLPRPPAWDWPISTNRGNVPVITSVLLGLTGALLWRALAGAPALTGRLSRWGASLQERLRGIAAGPLDNGLLAGFLGGTTLGWGGLLACLPGRLEGPAIGVLPVVLLTGALGYGCWRLLRAGGFRLPGRPVGRWWLWALAGLAGGLGPFALAGVGLCLGTA